MQRWMFPRSVFALGDGKERMKRRAFWRNVLGLVILAGFVINLVAAVVYDWFDYP